MLKYACPLAPPGNTHSNTALLWQKQWAGECETHVAGNKNNPAR